jgi:peptide chain release factor 1
MAAMAQEEIDSAEAELRSWKTNCSACCCPKTRTTRAAFVEIRAGTGGDESALFAGDLAAHVHPLRRPQGWKTRS